MRDETRYPEADEILREQLSAMLDDELEADTTRFMLSRLQHDQRLSDTLDRYQLIQQCLRQESMLLPGDEQVRTRVRVALEHTRQEPGKRQAPAWLRPLGGVAVAASVAMLAIFSVESLRQQPGSEMAGLSNTPTASVVSATPLNNVSLPLAEQQTSIQPVSHTQVLPARLNQYLRGPGVRQVVDGQQPVRYIYLVRPTGQQAMLQEIPQR